MNLIETLKQIVESRRIRRQLSNAAKNLRFPGDLRLKSLISKKTARGIYDSRGNHLDFEENWRQTFDSRRHSAENLK